jgi:hypothetical protein
VLSCGLMSQGDHRRVSSDQPSLGEVVVPAIAIIVEFETLDGSEGRFMDLIS